jgi:predicted ATPase
MLLEFSVSNYLSFRERQTFSMSAAPRMRKKENTFPAPVDGEKLPDLLKVAVMYGPNASGKSNFLKALGVVTGIARNAGDNSNRSLPIAPFKFDQALLSEPSVFELHFLCGRQRYEFHLAVTRDRVVHEQLTAYPSGKEMLVYERRHFDGSDHYKIGNLEGGQTVHEAWQKLTPPRALFISQAVANSSEELTQLRKPHAWLTHAVLATDPNGIADFAEISLGLSRKDEAFGRRIASFLSDVDVPVARIRIERSDPPQKPKLTAADFAAAGIGQGNSMRTPLKIPVRQQAVFTHKTALGEAEFAFQDESEGTQNLVGFWWPWTTRNLGADSERCVLAVDELDSSLHPSIVANLVKLHIQAKVPSQLIFSTHGTHLMDSGLLRRDQIWIAERDQNGATQLRSIHDFQGREGEDLEKRYFEGRYRGLPMVSG